MSHRYTQFSRHGSSTAFTPAMSPGGSSPEKLLGQSSSAATLAAGHRSASQQRESSRGSTQSLFALGSMHPSRVYSAPQMKVGVSIDPCQPKYRHQPSAPAGRQQLHATSGRPFPHRHGRASTAPIPAVLWSFVPPHRASPHKERRAVAFRDAPGKQRCARRLRPS